MTPWTPWANFGNYYFPFPDYSDPYDNATSDMVVVDTGRGIFHVHQGLIDHFFPRLVHHLDSFGIINIPILSESLYVNTGHRIAIRKIARILHTLFGLLRKESTAAQGFARSIPNLLEKMLMQDTFRARPDGTPQIRSHFLVFAVFARTAGSNQLASVLVRFFLEFRRDILSCERSSHLGDWTIAIAELADLASRSDVYRCLQYLSEKRDKIHSTYHNSGTHDAQLAAALQMMLMAAGQYRGRGRSADKRLRYMDIPRAQTVPPQMNYPPQLLLPPQHNQLMIPSPYQYGFPPSPSPSMDWALSTGYMENEIENVAVRQDVVETRLDNLEYHMGMI
ncbi:hypothetical protein K504DRAFT_461748 [Pleomassaria siparia CBS 279.74]|uniref:Uncharacterized protein n=1 Tax=Pleomassaria siparia CBS 279.74 TaxID=1314801 RepID=A0A6G1KKM2_9PLEO|nr:hypothetical protein K504DRAFT_461748 [Pleomassaria siparia CBS 279.74]